MALNKVNYVDDETVIGADNLNDIQDAIIALEGKTVNIKNVAELSYTADANNRIQMKNGDTNVYPVISQLETAAVPFVVEDYTKNLTARKNNGVVELSGFITPSTRMSSFISGSTIATMPEGFRPRATIGIIVFGQNTSDISTSNAYVFYAEILITGEIKLYGKTADLQASRTLRLTAMYLEG